MVTVKVAVSKDGALEAIVNSRGMPKAATDSGRMLMTSAISEGISMS